MNGGEFLCLNSNFTEVNSGCVCCYFFILLTLDFEVDPFLVLKVCKFLTISLNDLLLKACLVLNGFKAKHLDQHEAQNFLRVIKHTLVPVGILDVAGHA